MIYQDFTSFWNWNRAKLRYQDNDAPFLLLNSILIMFFIFKNGSKNEPGNLSTCTKKLSFGNTQM